LIRGAELAINCAVRQLKLGTPGRHHILDAVIPAQLSVSWYLTSRPSLLVPQPPHVCLCLFIASNQIAGTMPHSRGHRHGSNRRVKEATEAADESKPTVTPTPTPTTNPIGNAKARKAAKRKVKKSFKQVSSSRSVFKI
jgi:hypothetical protein